MQVPVFVVIARGIGSTNPQADGCYRTEHDAEVALRSAHFGAKKAEKLYNRQYYAVDGKEVGVIVKEYRAVEKRGA